MCKFKITKIIYSNLKCRTTYYVPKVSLQCILKAMIHHIRIIKKDAILFSKTTQIPLVKLLNPSKNPVALTTSAHFHYRQGKYCNNLATRVIPFFIVSKSSVGETILKTVLPHLPKDPVA